MKTHIYACNNTTCMLHIQTQSLTGTSKVLETVKKNKKY